MLTAYADTDAAISATNDVHLDYYLVKPWDPPEQRLYPVLDDLLDDWLATRRRSMVSGWLGIAGRRSLMRHGIFSPEIKFHIIGWIWPRTQRRRSCWT